MKIIRNSALHFQYFLLSKKDFIEDNFKKIYKNGKISHAYN